MYLQDNPFSYWRSCMADLTEKNFCMMYHLEILITGVFPILKAPSSMQAFKHTTPSYKDFTYIKVMIDFPSSFSLLQQAIKDCFY